MAYEQKPNTGSLFKNDKKTKEGHPDSKGSALIGGKEYWISGWKNKKGDGEPYVKLSFEEKKPRAEEEDAF